MPREIVDDFVLLNEHNQKNQSDHLLSEIKNGKIVFLMSDCGLPAFCDPGQYLVNQCHQNKITISCVPFANSIALGVALSGFPHGRFIFEGFLPAKDKEKREKHLRRILNSPDMSVLMDTPYRLSRLIDEINDYIPLNNKNRSIFLALELNSREEQLIRGNISFLKKQIKKEKKEFILIISPIEKNIKKDFNHKGKKQSERKKK